MKVQSRVDDAANAAWAFRRVALVAWCALAGLAGRAHGQSEFDKEPINYKQSQPTDPVSQLAASVEKGETSIAWDDQHGWLASILKHLEVPTSSQTLVFSKTSMQFRRISPRRPRAVYFNDDVYVGWVNGGDVLELGAVDPKLGAVFYTVDQKSATKPKFRRDNGECMACHANGRTQKVPGFLVRSVYPKASGQPDFRLGTLSTDHATDFKDRFGGWYVTGTHGEMRHRGNAIVTDEETTNPLDREAGANLSELPSNVRAEDYLEQGSDLVALMLLEHQSQMHNYVTKAGYATRTAIHQQTQMNQILERPDDYRSESTTRRIHAAAEQLVQYLFFCDEFELAAPVAGTTDFAREFSAVGIRDSKGRSLRDLDLKNRLLRYPCSYLVYSDSFCALPIDAANRVKERMLQILRGEDPSEEYAHLSKADRQNILEILTETHPWFQNANQ